MTTAGTDWRSRVAWTASALRAVSLAGNGLATAKRTKSGTLIAYAERELQDAVDAARGLDIGWGPIGSALGIARGNAYQRYRKKPPRTALRPTIGQHRHPRP